MAFVQCASVMPPLAAFFYALAAVLTTPAQSQPCGYLVDVKMHPNKTKLISTNLVTGRIYEVDVVTGQYNVLVKMGSPHGLLVSPDTFYAAEINAGRVTKYDFATKEVSNAFPSISFGGTGWQHGPARLLGVDMYTFLVSQPARSRILKVTSDGHSWAASEFLTGPRADGVIRGPEGTLLVNDLAPKGKIYAVNATTGEVLGTILENALNLPTDILYYKGKIYVAEVGGQQVSVLVQDTSGQWTREHMLRMTMPTGLDVGIDPTTGHATLYVALSLPREIWKYDLDNGYSKSLLTKFECSPTANERLVNV